MYFTAQGLTLISIQLNLHLFLILRIRKRRRIRIIKPRLKFNQHWRKRAQLCWDTACSCTHLVQAGQRIKIWPRDSERVVETLYYNVKISIIAQRREDSSTSRSPLTFRRKNSFVINHLLHAENFACLKIWREVKSKLAKTFLQLGSNKCLMKHWYGRTVSYTRDEESIPSFKEPNA